MKISRHLINKLDNNRFIAFCLLLAIINKSLISIVYTDLEADKSLYLLFATTFLKNNTWLEPLQLIDTNGSYYIFNPAIYSPIYSFLAAPLIYITGSYYKTSYLIDGISWIVFFTGLYKFSNSFFLKKIISGIFILFISFFTYPHILTSTPKDTLSIGLIFWCIYLLSKFIRNKNLTIVDILVNSVMLFLLAISKFLYIPLVIIFIFFLMAHAIIKKNKKQLFYSSYIAFISLSLILSLKIFFDNQEIIFPQVIFPTRQKLFITTWQPENLLFFYPFILSALFNLDFIGVQFEKLFRFSYPIFMNVIRCLDVSIMICCIVFFKRIINQFNKISYAILLISIAISFAILFMVVYMSTSYKTITDMNSGSIWTYVAEARFYLFIVVFIQVLFFYYIFNRPLNGLIKFLLVCFYSFELLHGIYFSVKQIPKSSEIQQELESKSAIKKVTNVALALQKENPLYTIKIISNNEHLRWYAILHGLNAFAHSKDLNYNDVTKDKKTIYLLIKEQYNNNNESMNVSVGIPHLDIDPFLVQFVKNN